MKIFVSLLLLPVMVILIGADEVQIVGPDRVQEFHACVGTTAYIPWPLNVISRTGHASTVITLIFKRRHSEKKMEIATFNGRRQLSAAKPFIDRISTSSEHSGIFLEKITFDDAGTYIAQARMSSGQMWTRTTNLTVHMRPIVHHGRLNMSQSPVRKQGRAHCVNISCGVLEYAGYPPAKYVWTALSKVVAVKSATDDSLSSIQMCSPFFGDVTCSIAGYSSVCTYDHVATLHLDLPGPPANSSSLTKAHVTRDLVLKIVMPILAVGIPLVVLGVWVLSHMLKSYPQYREQRHYEKRHKDSNNKHHGSAALMLDMSYAPSTSQDPQMENDAEDNVTTEQTHNNDPPSDIEEYENMDMKDVMVDLDEETEPKYNNENHIPRIHEDIMEHDEEDEMHEIDDEDAEDDSDEEEEDEDDEDDHKRSESWPLMEGNPDSVNTVV